MLVDWHAQRRRSATPLRTDLLLLRARLADERVVVGGRHLVQSTLNSNG
jgi:hypothetical protein